jgi:hypothetical protein
VAASVSQPFIDCADNAEKVARIERENFDFAYSDGDHHADTMLDFDLVRRCGRVLFHEYWPMQPPVWNLVNSLPRGEVIKCEHDCLAYWSAR